MLTRTGAMNIMRRIMESGGLTEDMEKDIGRLRDDFDEREGILKRYGETYDGEDREEYDWVERETEKQAEESSQDGTDWKSEYEALHARYLDRFFGVNPTGDETNTDVEDEGQEEEPSQPTVEDILIKKED